MADLNLSHGTVTDGGGTRAMANPSYANDGDPLTHAFANAFAAGAGTYTARLKTDLGASYASDGMILRHINPHDSGWIGADWSSDGLSWTDLSATISFDATENVTTISYTEQSARYWRIRHSTTITGIEYRASVSVDTWEITEATTTPIPPVAEFSATPRAGLPGLVVDFTDLSTGSPTSWAWDFGDGGTSTSQNVTHVYDDAGTYDVELVATNGDGSDTETKTGYIVVFDPSPGVGVEWEDETFEDITQDVIRYTTTQSVSDPHVASGSYSGSVIIRLRNRENRYNPENASGPLYGLLKDGPRVHLAVNADGTFGASALEVYGVVAARITEITVIPTPGSAEGFPAFVELVCEDPISWISRARVTVADSRTRSHKELRTAVLAAANETTLDLASEPETMPLSSADGTAGAILEGINAANGTRHYARPSSSPDIWYEYVTVRRTQKLTGVADWTVDEDYVTGTDGWRKSAETVINQQRVTVEPVTFSPSTAQVWEAPNLPITVTGTRVMWIRFDAYVDSPTIDLNYTGDAMVATILSYGDTAKLTFVSAGLTNIRALSILGALARTALQDSVVVDDATGSQDAPRGIRVGPERGGPLVGVIASAEGLAKHIVWRYADAKYMPTIEVTNWLPDMYRVQMYDTVSLTSTHIGVTDRIFEVVRITRTCDLATSESVLHRATFGLIESRVQTAKGWFVLDSSVLDGSDVLAY